MAEQQHWSPLGALPLINFYSHSLAQAEAQREPGQRLSSSYDSAGWVCLKH
jgi:hypothetical protein